MVNGRYVYCRSGAEDGEEVYQQVDRVVCLLEMRPGCPTCPNSQFEALFQIRIGDQVVACPRWESEQERAVGKDPVGYVFTQRAVCLSDKPFFFCLACPNGKPHMAPKAELKWFEEERRQSKIEHELDEEHDE